MAVEVGYTHDSFDLAKSSNSSFLFPFADMMSSNWTSSGGQPKLDLIRPQTRLKYCC